MLIEVKVPVLSESITEATLAHWLKKAGDYVKQDENLVDLETDKVMLEIAAPSQGVLKEIKYGDGSNVKSDEVIAVIDTAAQAVNDTSVSQASVAQPAAVASQAAVTPIRSRMSEATLEEYESETGAAQGLSPAVRKLITEYELDPAAIIGTGKDGRLTKADVIKYIKSLSQRHEDEREETPASAAPAPTPRVSQLKPLTAEERPEKRVAMSRLRQRVAERLKEAQNTAAILTTFNEVNMKPIMDLRSKYKDSFEEKHGTKLGFMSFFVRACVDALKQFPVINASIDDDDIIYHGYYDVGIAVGSPRGLVVPILRNADSMSFAEIEIAIKTYTKKAKEGKLSLDDLTGGTFSISNGGVYGSMLSTPILNPPQSAILGMHNIKERAVVENGEIVVRPMMYLALSYDHRIIDGHDAVLFLVAIKQALEDPTRMLLDI
jgi:2-oxoglutarate dehydrogenase E2 component (dihydrolipoamide succinyltransferase)